MTDSEPEPYDLTGSDGDEEGKKGRGAPADVFNIIRSQKLQGLKYTICVSYCVSLHNTMALACLS